MPERCRHSVKKAGLGIALLNGMHITNDMEIIRNVFPTPPDITFVARMNPKSRNASVKALVAEIANEFEQIGLIQAAETLFSNFVKQNCVLSLGCRQCCMNLPL